MNRIYLDNAATTPLAEEVIDAMVDAVSYTHLDVYKRQQLEELLHPMFMVKIITQRVAFQIMF